MIKVFTDSTSYINDEILKELDIQILPLSVSIDDEHFIETEIDNEKFFHLMNNAEGFPKSSQPETDTILKAFTKTVEDGDTVVGIFISSKMSGTYSSCNLVKNMVLEQHPDAQIHLIDSTSNCMQMGLAVIDAATAAKKGRSIDTVLETVYNTMHRTRFLFVPNTLTYLEKGGRIGRASALLGNVLHIIPILTVINGETNSMHKVRTHKKAINKMLSILKEDIESLGIEKIVLNHINAPEMAKDLIDKIQALTDIKIEISSIGPVIGVHVGPKTVGIIYKTIKEHPLNAELVYGV